jgi:hypothetical protein
MEMTNKELRLLQDVLSIHLQTKQKNGETISAEYKELYFKLTYEALKASNKTKGELIR